MAAILSRPQCVKHIPVWKTFFQPWFLGFGIFPWSGMLPSDPRFTMKNALCTTILVKRIQNIFERFLNIFLNHFSSKVDETFETSVFHVIIYCIYTSRIEGCHFAIWYQFSATYTCAYPTVKILIKFKIQSKYICLYFFNISVQSQRQRNFAHSMTAQLLWYM